MKLKKLTINNIASIEKAEIDFDCAPLADERLFLITGETGSGKSTIIDCLCLALYGTTPRMKSAKKVEYENPRSDGTDSETFKTDDTRQLMRRGTVQASVELTFDDNDGKPYIAIWEAHRAHKSITGNILTPERILRTADGVTPPVFLTKINDINREVMKIVGLDLDQFFRTVVLAQGKFSEFLNSEEKAKSDLLEKLTGTEIYTQLGRKIHENCQEKKKKCDILSGQMENIELLTDEQKKSINDEITQKDNELTAVKTRHDMAGKMAKWLDEMGKNEQETARNREQLAEKLTQAKAPEFIAQQSLVRDWESTAEARQQLKQQQDAEKRLETLQRQLPDLQERYDRLCAALRAAVADLDARQKKRDEIGQNIRQEEPNKDMYANIGQIKSLLNLLDKTRREIAEYSDGLTLDKNRKPKAEEKLKEAKEALQAREQELKRLQEQYQALHVEDIHTEKDRLNKAKEELNRLITKHEAVDKAQNDIKELTGKRETEETNLRKEKDALPLKQAAEENAKQNVERAKDWNALLIQARQTLQKGDLCPVCGHRIEQLLLPKSESELGQLQEAHAAALEALQKAQVLIQSIERHIADYNRQIDDARKDLNKKTSERDEQWQIIKPLLAQCGKKADEMASPAQCKGLIRDLEAHVETLNKQLQQANQLNNQVTEAQTAYNEAVKCLNTAKLDLNNLENGIRNQQNLIEECTKNVDSFTTQLNGLLVLEDWQQRHAAGQEFLVELEKAASAYQQMVDSHQQLTESIRLRSAAITAMLSSRASIQGLTDNGLTTDTVPDDLDGQWRSLETSHVQWSTQLDTEQKNVTRAQRAVADYIGQHPDVTMERLVELSGIEAAQIDGIKTAHKLLNDSIHTMQGAINTLTRQHNDLTAQKPDFPEQNRERLDDIIEQAGESIQTLTENLAKLRLDLANDARNVELMGNKLRDLEAAKADFLRWDRFREILGSADGFKFRKIAQSYILGDMLASANGYLRQFNNRYQLEANPSTLTILARDLVQGDLTAVTTLSGGESFMVSLALALALSGLSGKLFSMDTLFIDEGFGSLSPNYLDNVMETLNRLYDLGGRRVGIISHVEMLKERVPTQIRVTRDPDNNTVSRVQVTS